MYWHRLKNRLSFQRWSQLGFILLINSYAKGFQSGQIFAGASKSICVPVLNCYSCPGALGACPIGALQTVLGRGRFPFYVLGLMMAFGVVLGRAICGLLCPFGLVQDLLHKIPLPKYQLPTRLDRALRWLKYIVLALLVVLLPLLAAIQSGIATPYFCKWLCPAGTLGGALPLMATNPSLRALASALFGWKFAVLVLIVFASILIPRPFCRYLCPLGGGLQFLQWCELLRHYAGKIALHELWALRAGLPDGRGCARVAKQRGVYPLRPVQRCLSDGRDSPGLFTIAGSAGCARKTRINNPPLCTERCARRGIIFFT